MCQTNSTEVKAMLERIAKINEVEGFDPSVFAEEYAGLSSNEKRKYLPVVIRIAMFRMKYPDGRIAVNAVPDGVGFVGTARIYAHYKDAEHEFLSEASAYREPMKDKPAVSAREWAQTTAIGIALRNAGFGLQFEAAKDDFPNPDMIKVPIESSAAENETEQGDTPPSEAKTEQPPVQVELTEEERYKQALTTVCTMKKFEGRTLGDILLLEPGFVCWLAERYEGEHKELKTAAKLICEFSKKQAA